MDEVLDTTSMDEVLDTTSYHEPSGENHPPVANDDTAYRTSFYSYPLPYDPYPSNVNINVLANDTDPDGDQLHVATIAGKEVDTDLNTDLPDTVTLEQSGATVKLNADGSLTYTENGKYGDTDIKYVDTDIELEPVPLPEQDATLMASSDELVPIDPPIILKPVPWYWLVDSFTYSASDGTLSDEATVDVYRVSGCVLDSADPVA